MSQTAAPSLERAADFLWRNARLLERALFASRFLGGPPEAVVAALLGYRNADGGFGHALEPDARAPGSMPLHCEVALRALQDADVVHPEIALGVCEFLESVADPDSRVPIVLPLVLGHPHASHWSAPVFGGDSPNPTAVLAGLLRAQRVEHPWLERATQWSWRRLERPIGEAHEIMAALTFLEHAGDRDRATRLAITVAGQADKATWYLREPGGTSYGLTPLHLCPAPTCIARPAFPDALIDRHLDALADSQQADGGWPIHFTPPGPGAGLEWRGRWTLDALETLHAYGRLSG